MYASKTHFKMYKAGKRWLFVGLTAMGFVVGAVNASADVMADTVTENTTITEKNKSEKEQDVAKENTTHVEAPEIQKNTDSNNTSAASEDTVAKTDEASTSKVSEKVATAENAQATSDSSKDTNSNSKLSKQNNDSINEASVKDNHKTSKAAVTNNTVTSNKVADDTTSSNTTITESKTNTTPVSKNTDSDQSLVNKDTTREATTNIDNDIDTTQPQEHQKGTDVDVSKALANATVNEDKKSIDNQKKKDEAKKEATKADDNIASGTFGSSDWYIDAQGTLHFGAGEFGVSQIDVVSNNGLEINKNEWGKYASQIKKISFDDKVIANQQSGALFNGLSNLTTIENMQNFDTSNITVMDAIFYDDTNLTDIDVSQWDLSNVYSMYGTFFKCTSVSNLDVSQWNVSKVENMAYTFYEMTNLKALDVSNWDTSNVTNMFYTFLKDGLITVLDVSNWDVSNVENFTGTFSGMSGVKTLDVSHWDTGSATAMGSLFQDTNSLSTLDVSNWNVSNVLSLDFTFLNTGVKTLDVSKWDVSKVTNFFGTFEGVKFSRLDVSDWKTVSATNMSYMFCGSSFGTLNISNLNTDHVVDMSLMFNGIDVKSLDLSSFNTSNVTNMQSMFHGAKSIYKLDISNFDMGKVTNKEGMLTDLTSLRVLVLGSNTIINGTGLSEPNFKGTSNRWVAVAGGNENNPYGAKYYTSTDLMAAYNSSMSDTYVIGEDKSSIAGHDSTIIAGPNSKWTSSDNFSSGTGIDGSPLDFSKVVVGGTVDTETPGNYDVSYTYTDEAGKDVTDTITVHVVASQVSIAGHDSTIIAGPNSKWNAKDNFDSATDAEGNPIGLNKVAVTGEVNAQVPGDYEITYSYTDIYGNEASETITVHVIASQVSVAGHDSTIIAGPNSRWNASDNFNGATDAEGNPIDFKDVTTNGQVDPTVVGNYDVTYSYIDAYGNEASETITVHVIASQVSVAGHDSTIIAGPNSRWNASDNFNGATDVEGNPIDFKDVTTNGQVDPTVVGNYDVTYSYIDAYGNEASKIITVHVIESKVSIDSHDSTIIAGPNSKWDAKDNFNDATDAEGNPVEFKDVIANGQVDPTVVGNYEVIYSYTDAYGNEASKTITVHVIVSQVSVDSHNSTVIAGPSSKWGAKDNFNGATDAEGNPVELNKVSVTGEANAQVPGDYEITYSYTDIYGNEANETITVHVIASQASVAGHDSTIIAGPNSKWNAKDNFDSATDAEGNPVELSKITVTGEANAQVPGNYEVTYSYIDAYGNKVSKTITVHMIASQASVAGHDSTIIAGPNSKWDASDNFDGATDAEGNPIGLNKVAVTGEANAQVPGNYEVTYSYTDAYGNVVNKTIMVRVVASATPNTPSNPDRPDKSADTDVPDTSMKPSNSDTVGLPTKSKSNNLVKITNKRVANIVQAKKHSKTVSTSKVNTLPQTGENDSNIETTIGVMGLLASVMGLIGFGKRRNRED